MHLPHPLENEVLKAKLLVEALPYIQKFKGKTIVVKVGGAVLDEAEQQRSLIRDLVLLKFVGMRPVLLHGGGRSISQLLSQLGRASRFVDGLRITDPETMKIVEMVLSGLVNKKLVSLTQQQGGRAVGLSGKDDALFVATPLLKAGVDYGRVGELTAVNQAVVKKLCEDVFIPIISPVAMDRAGESLNVNADFASTALAIALKAEKLIFITDVRGVLREVSNPASLISKISLTELKTLKKAPFISQGMLPKLAAAQRALESGVRQVHLISGRVFHALLIELLTETGSGTFIEK